MYPKSGHGHLGVMIVLVCPQQPLEDLNKQHFSTSSITDLEKSSNWTNSKACIYRYIYMMYMYIYIFLYIYKTLSDTNPRDVPEIEEIVDLGWCWQEPADNGLVHLNGGLGHDFTNWLHLLLKVLQLLVDHGAKDPFDLGLLVGGKMRQVTYVLSGLITKNMVILTCGDNRPVEMSY